MKKNIQNSLSFLFLVFCVLLIFTQQARATNVTVSSISDLQAQLNNTSADTIFIQPGEYTITAGYISVPRNVCVLGLGDHEVVLSTGGNFRHFSMAHGVSWELVNVVLVGPNVTYNVSPKTFTPKPTFITGSGGIFGQGGSIKVTNCKIGGCASPVRGGAIESNTNTLILEDSELLYNISGSEGGAIFIDNPLTLKNVTIKYSKSGFDDTTQTVSKSVGSGGAIFARAQCTMQGNIVLENNEACVNGGALDIGPAGAFDLTELTSLTIKNNFTYIGSGGGIHTGAPLTLDNTAGNILIYPNTAGFNGGAIATTAAITLKNIEISNCKAGYDPNTSTLSRTGSGGAIMAHNSLILQGNCFFTGNKAYADGGAINKADTGTFDVSNIDSLIITNNETYTGNGGGICTHNPLTLDNTNGKIKLYPNTAGLSGGAIMAHLNATLTLKNIEISNCKAGYDPITATVSRAGGAGGAIRAGGILILQGNCAFKNNKSYADGGAIFKDAGKIFDVSGLTKLTVTNNATYFGYGGGITTYASLTLDNSVADILIYPNTSRGNAGSIMAYLGAPLTLKDIEISNCIAGYDPIKDSVYAAPGLPGHSGGAIVASDSLILKGNCIFRNNKAVGDGGAIFKGTDKGGAYEGKIFDVSGITALTIINNATYTGNGGGICTYADLKLDNTNGNILLYPNTAGQSGGGIWTNALLTLKNIEISNCKAGYDPNTSTLSRAGSGGAIFVNNALTLEGGVIFRNNRVRTEGGGIYKVGAGAFTTNNLKTFYLENNTAGLSGGGIFTASKLELKNLDTCAISANEAVYGGGIFMLAPAALTLDGKIEISKNKATNQGGGLYTGGVLTLSNLFIKNNYANNQGGGVYALKKTTLTDVVISENKSLNAGGGIAFAAATTDTLSLRGTVIFSKDSTAYQGGGAIAFTTGLPSQAVLYAAKEDGLQCITIDSCYSGGDGAAINAAIVAAAATNRVIIKGGLGVPITISNNTAIGNCGGIQITGHTELEGILFEKNKGANNSSVFRTNSSTSTSASTIKNCTFTGNNGGAAVNITGAAIAGDGSISNCTFYNNPTGAIAAGKPTNVTFCTFYNNSTSPTNTTYYGCIFKNSTGGTTANNSIIVNAADNTVFASETLANNGGPTPTLMIKYGGPAHNTVALSTNGWGETKDQRYEKRAVSCAYDAGAVELNVEDTVLLKSFVSLCQGAQLNADTLILKAPNMLDTLYYTNRQYNVELPMPMKVSPLQDTIFVRLVPVSNCPPIDTFIVLNVTSVNIIPKPAAVCAGNLLRLIADTSFVSTVSWNNYDKIATATGQNSDTLDLTTFMRKTDTTAYVYAIVTAKNGCQTYDSVAVTVSGNPTMQIKNVSGTESCFGSKYQFDLIKTNSSYFECVGGSGDFQPFRRDTNTIGTSAYAYDSTRFYYIPSAAEAGTTVKLGLKTGGGVCGYLYDTVKFLVLPRTTSMALDFVLQPVGEQHTCEDTVYTFKIKTAQDGSLTNMKITLSDDNITNMIADSAIYTYPYLSGLSQKVIGAKSGLRTSFLLPGILPGNDSALVQIHVKAACGFLSKGTVKFTLDAKTVCNDSVPQVAMQSNPYVLVDTTTVSIYRFENTTGPLVVNSKTTDTLTLRVKANIEAANGTLTDSLTERILINIPQGLELISESFRPIRNATGGRTVFPVTGGTQMELVVPSDIEKDSIIYEIKVSAKNAPCNSYIIWYEAIFIDSIECDTRCISYKLLDHVEDTIHVERYAFTLNNIQAGVQQGVWDGTVQLNAISGFFKEDSLKVVFYVDRNNNNTYTPGVDDSITMSYIKSIVDIDAGDTLPAAFSNIPVVPGYQLIAYSNDSLLCSPVQFPITILTGPDTTCQNVTAIMKMPTGMTEYRLDAISGATRIPVTTKTNYPNDSIAYIRFTSAFGNQTITGGYTRTIGEDTLRSEATSFSLYVNPELKQKGLKTINNQTAYCTPTQVKIWVDSLQNADSVLWMASTVAGTLLNVKTDTLTYVLNPRNNDTTLKVYFTAYAKAPCSNYVDSLTLTLYSTLFQVAPRDTSICGNNSVFFNLPAALGGHNNTYQWQDSTKIHAWQNISSAINPAYTTPNLTDTTWYRRIVKSDCGVSDTTVVARIDVKPVPAFVVRDSVKVQSAINLTTLVSNLQNITAAELLFSKNITFTPTIPAAYSPGAYHETIYVKAVKNSCESEIKSLTVNPYCGGDSTAANPYEICDAPTLAYMRDKVNATTTYAGSYFLVTNSLNLSAYTSWTPIGTSARRFSGNFDGGNYIIRNLQITGSANLGLFAYTGSSSVIKNTGVETTPQGVSGSGGNIAILVGNHQGTIMNCYVSGTVSGNDAGGLVGGQGNVSGNLINQCYAFVNMNGLGGNGPGGLVGVLRGALANSYAFGDVYTAGTAGTGGLVGVGSNNTNITNSYAAGNVIATSSAPVGGIVGNISTGSTVLKNSIALNKIINSLSSATFRVDGQKNTGATLLSNYAYEKMMVNGSPKTSTDKNSLDGASQSLSDFKDYNFYTTVGNWDAEPWLINNIDDNAAKWNIWDGFSYPYLQTQSAPVAFDETQLLSSEMNGSLRSDVTTDSVKVYKKTGSSLTYLGLATLDNMANTWTFSDASLQNRKDTITLIAYENGKPWPSYPVSLLYKVCTGPLNGTYTIPGDFTSLKEAADYYNDCGIAADSKLEIKADLVETETSDFLGTAPGSKDWVLTITTDNNRHTVGGNINGALVRLIAANNITFDGVVIADKNNTTANQLAFVNTNPVAEDIYTVQILRDINNNQGKNIIIRNTELSNTAKQSTKNYGLYVATDSVRVEGCYIHDVGLAAYFNNSKRIFVDTCVMRDLVFYGIYANVTSNYTDADYRVLRNYITDIKNDSQETVAGIALITASTGNAMVRNNVIENIVNNYSTTFNTRTSGIHIQLSGTIHSVKNSVRNISSNTSTLTRGIMLMPNSGYALLDSCLVDNITGQDWVYAVWVYSLDPNASGEVLHSSISNIHAVNSVATAIQVDAPLKVAYNRVWNVLSDKHNAHYVYQSSVNPAATPQNPYPISISNNMFSGYLSTGSSTGTVLARAIFMTLATHFSITHNTISMDKKDGSYDNAGPTGVTILQVSQALSGIMPEIRNNIFINNYTQKNNSQIIDINIPSGGLPLFSDNIYNYSGTGKMAKVAGSTTSTSDIASWNTYAQDNGKSVPVSMSDPANGDAHLIAPSLTDARLAAHLLSNVTDDFDGDIRTVCINATGADNYQAANLHFENISVPAICQGDSAAIYMHVVNGIADAQSMYQYTINGETAWNNVEVASTGTMYDSLAFYPLYPDSVIKTSGIYQLTIKDANGCQNDTSFMVTVNPLPEAKLSQSDTICFGDKVELIIKLTLGERQPEWKVEYQEGLILQPEMTNNTGTDEIPFEVQPAINTIYTLKKITDGNGCVRNY